MILPTAELSRSRKLHHVGLGALFVQGLAGLMQPSLIFVAVLAAMIGYGAAAALRPDAAFPLSTAATLAPPLATDMALVPVDSALTMRAASP